jgi:DNA-binding NarL/FixJ family response regulator
MPITVLLADDSDVMRTAIARLLKDDPGVEFLGAATTFAGALVQTAALKPDVLLLDLHMPDEDGYEPELLKAQFLQHTQHILAVSIWNDDKAKELAARFGALALLDKTKLFYELIPAIKECGLSVAKKPVRKASKKVSAAPIEGAATDSSG